MRDETRYRHMGYSYRLTARVLLYAPSHRQDSTYHSLCYTSCAALAGTRNSSMGPPHEGSIRRPIAPRANALTTELHLPRHGHRYRDVWISSKKNPTDRMPLLDQLWSTGWNEMSRKEHFNRPQNHEITALMTINVAYKSK